MQKEYQKPELFTSVVNAEGAREETEYKTQVDERNYTHKLINFVKAMLLG